MAEVLDGEQVSGTDPSEVVASETDIKSGDVTGSTDTPENEVKEAETEEQLGNRKDYLGWNTWCINFDVEYAKPYPEERPYYC